MDHIVKTILMSNIIMFYYATFLWSCSNSTYLIIIHTKIEQKQKFLQSNRSWTCVRDDLRLPLCQHTNKKKQTKLFDALVKHILVRYLAIAPTMRNDSISSLNLFVRVIYSPFIMWWHHWLTFQGTFTLKYL